MTKIISLAAATASLLSTVALAESSNPIQDSRMMMAHWDCQFYAQDMDSDDKVKHHFERGLSFGRSYYEGIASGMISDAEIKESVHPFLHFFLEGPSIDFVLGQVNRSIRESVSAELQRGLDDIEDGDEAMRLLKVAASASYRNANCGLLASE